MILAVVEVKVHKKIRSN